MSSAGDDKKVVFDFRSKSMASTKTESPENNMVDTPEHLTLAQRTRSQTCPEPERPAGRFPKPAPVGTYSSNPSPRPGHYDPRIGMKARNNSDRWEQNRPFRSMSRDAREHCMGGIYAGPSGQSTLKAPVNAGRPAQSGYGFQHGNYAGGKPVISHAQLVREAFICKTAQEMMKDFTSIVIEVKVQRGARVMWTSVPDDLKHIFNVTDIKTVDTWKQTMHGDCQLDISMFKRGDRIKMSVQSIGVSGKHMHQPLIRGVPDAIAHPETLAKSTENSPRMDRAASVHSMVSLCRSGGRSRANTVGTPPRSGESGDEQPRSTLQEHPRFCAVKPEPAARFNRGNTKTFSQQRAKEFTHVSMRGRANS